MNAFLARQFAEQGDYLRANVHLGAFRDRLFDSKADHDLPIVARMDFAATHQRLGNPTKGLSFLGDADAFSASDEVASYKELKLRLLLDADRMAEAEELVDDTLETTFESIDGRLALARYRTEIEWKQGAKQLLEQLREQFKKFELSPDQAMELLLLEAKCSNNSNALPEILETTSVKPAAVAARGRVLMMLAKKVDDAQVEAKVAAYERVLSNFALLPNHTVAFAAMESLSRLYEDQKLMDEAKSWREQLWLRLQATNELGTDQAAWCAISVLRNGSDMHDRERVLQLLKSRPEVNRRNLYVLRQLLTYDFEIGIQRNDSQRAHASLTQICPIEEKLWGEDSLEYAFVLASKGYVERQLASSREEQDSEARAKLIVKEQIPRKDDCPAKLFLKASLVAKNNGKGKSTRDWIHLYLMHYLNPSEAQLGMLRHVYEQVEDQESAAAQAIRPALN